jgi:molybdate transport system regulatory protein
METNRLQYRLFLDTENGSFLGDTRVRLLEAIESYGSITKAAKSVGLSYKAAWEQVDSINRQSTELVVNRLTGGSNGGGSSLTPYGLRLVAFYRAVEWDHQTAIEELALHLRSGTDPCCFRYLLRKRAIGRGPQLSQNISE